MYYRQWRTEDFGVPGQYFFEFPSTESSSDEVSKMFSGDLLGFIDFTLYKWFIILEWFYRVAHL